MRTMGWMLQHSPRRGNGFQQKRGQAKPCLGIGLLRLARSGDSSPFPVGLSCQAWFREMSCPCSLGVDVAAYPSPGSLGAMWAWIS